MSTIEKLIVQIFERKNSIIEQVRHQVELYDQQLASTLLIHGIHPPSWLWNHQAPPSGRIISELLLPLPRQPVPDFDAFKYNSISTVPEYNFDRGDEAVAKACFDNVFDISVEVQAAAASPEKQVATRFDDGHSLSRVEFKRSKSRQRALELRSSAKSGSKSYAQEGNVSAVSYGNGAPGVDELLRSHEHVGVLFRGQIDKPTQFQETLNIRLGGTESERRNTVCSEDIASETVPSRPLNHELDSTEQDIRCANKTLGVVAGGQVDENCFEEILSAAAHGKCSSDAALGVHNLSTTGEASLPCRISISNISSKKLSDVVPTICAAYKDNERGSAFSSNSLQDHPCAFKSSDLMTSSISGDINSGIIKEATDDHSSSDKGFGILSANPVKTESSLLITSELIPNFPAAEKDGATSGVLLVSNLSQSLDHALQSPQSTSPAANMTSSKSSGVKTSELHTSSCDLEARSSLPEDMNMFKIEEEALHLQIETVEQPDLQQEDENTTECDLPLFIGDVQDQENLYRVRSLSCNDKSKASAVSHHVHVAEDVVGVEENLKNEATSTPLKSSASSFSKLLGNVKTESPRFLSHKAKQQSNDNMTIEKTREAFLEGGHLSWDVQERLNKEHSESETLSIESALEKESYVAGFEENTFFDCKYDGLMGTDQIMPVLEGFIMDTDDGESLFASGQIDIEESSLPGSALKRASFLERLCQSSSRNTPISHFPMTYGLQKTSDLFQSVPTGLLEHISLVGGCSNTKLQKKSHSAGQPVSTGFNMSTPCLSPFKKNWDHSKSSSGLRSQGSLNPELVCFTIEEDPGNCAEIVKHDDAAEAPQSGGSCLKISMKRKPLTDITEDVNDPHPLVSVNNKHVLEAGQTPKFCFRSQLDSTGTEANLTGAQTRAGKKLGKKISSKKRRLNDAKENGNVSVGANGGKQVTDSLKEKPKYSENLKTTLGVSDQLKVLRSNNIVSNMSSLIQLVQQKKTAAVTGKRDVKVKALEAAEAAKRLAEKKENERKAKKEAWKAEKARLEQENLLQLELKKKKKEEELKKKEAEMAARKRIREEEEKKEKEGKRRRIEEARKQQHEQEKKQADKVTRHQADGSRINQKDPNTAQEQFTETEIGVRKGKVTTEGDDKSSTVPCYTKTSNALKKTYISSSNLIKVASDFNTISEENPKDKTEVPQSYDISPYRSSDDEDEDGDDENEYDRSKDKIVPAWASKNSLAEAVFSLQHINPDEILPPESFCSITEVLIPRKLLVK